MNGHSSIVLGIEKFCPTCRPNMVSGGALKTPSKPPFKVTLNTLQTNAVGLQLPSACRLIVAVLETDSRLKSCS
jgi:hypothetical protein